MAAFENLDLAAAVGFEAVIQYQVANALREVGDIAAAGRIYGELWDGRPAVGEQREVHTLVGIQLADVYYVQGRFHDAQGILTQIAELDDGDHAREVAEALRILGHIERFNELNDRGLSRYEMANTLFSRCEDLFGQAMIQTNLAEASWPIDPGNAVRLADRAIELNDALGALLEVGKARTAGAYARLLLGQLSNARGEVEAASRSTSASATDSALPRHGCAERSCALPAATKLEPSRISPPLCEAWRKAMRIRRSDLRVRTPRCSWATRAGGHRKSGAPHGVPCSGCGTRTRASAGSSCSSND